ncbi:MAG: hypothetical protein HZA00_05110 [Nitrospinae bacterium]|nr:hypothetical protein [Nitrospinota bacterium]
MKKYIYLFAIIILFPFSAPSLTLNTDTDTYTYTMIRGLLLPSIAEAYTYQDVENAYNNAKTQYPNYKIWIEEVQGGYRLWRRLKNTYYMLKTYMTDGQAWSTGVGVADPTISSCKGDKALVNLGSNATFYVFINFLGATGYQVAKYCDGTEGRWDASIQYHSGVSSPCWFSIDYVNVNCKSGDILLQEFIPVDLCLDKTTGNYVPCLKNCKDPVTGDPAVEICGNGIDDNCNGQIDEGCRQCTDNDGDGYYAYDSANCPEGNDCNDNDPAINPATLWYKDADNDGYSDGTTSSGCERPNGYKLASELKATSGDCNDNDASKNPADIDGDGYSTCTGDCNDDDSAIHPGATEKCDKKDNNCNGEIDEGACDPCLKLPLNSSANAANGNLSHNQELFTSKSTGLSVSMTLYYNSLYSGSGHIGTGWTHSYDITLKEFSDGSILFREGNDRRLYTLSGSNYINQAGDYSTLIKNVDATYLLTKKDGVKYIFDTASKLTKVEDRLGNTMTFVYTGNNLTEITDSVGRKTTLSYDSNNRLTQLITHNSQLTTFSYNSSGYLTAVTDSAGYSWTYTYDDNGFMLTKSDTEGNVVTYTYDSEGRVISSTDSAGKTKTISYTSPLVGEGGVRGQATITEKDGGVWTHKYDTTQGVLTEKTDPQGNTTTYQYDNSKNLTKETAPDGSITGYTYDTQGNMTSTTDASGNITNYTYNNYGQTTSIKDPQNNVTYYSYDTYGNLNSVTDLSGGITQFNYDSKGNITRITSPNGGVTVYEYDSYNNLTKITDPAGNTTLFTYDSAGNMTSMTDSSGNTTRFEYNSLNQLIRTIDPNGNVTEYSYDSRGNKTSQTDANGNMTYYEYTPVGQGFSLAKVTDALGNVTTYTYGGTGGCPSCGSGGGDNLTSITDAKGNITTYEYDTLGRLTKETDSLSNTISYSYDSKGNLISRTDANGNTITYTYDALGRLIKKTYPDSTTESFTYDSKGNILTATNQHISYTFTYDASGKPLTVTDSYGRVIKYEYDTAGNKVKMTTPEGKEIKYNYDINHRLTQIKSPSPLVEEGGGEGVFSFTYDTSGRRTKLTYPNGVTTTYSYDTAGSLTNLLTQYAELKEQGKKKPPILKLQTIDSFTYTHDKVGNRLSKTENISPLFSKEGAGGVKYDYSYDSIYRLLQSLPTKLNGKDKELENKAEIFTYDAVGNRLTGPKEKLSYTYNTANQLTELTKQKKDEEERKREFTYDNNGNLVKMIELDDEGQINKTTIYTYDYENQLTKVEILKSEILNLKSKIKVITFTYDPFGRRLSKSVSHLSLRGEAEAISDDDDDSGDKDDEDKESPRTTYYVYDNEDIIMEYNHKGKVTARYVHGAGIDEPLAIDLSLPLLTKEGTKGRSAVYYYHADGLGSITALTDAKGKVIQRYEYDSFGKLKRHEHKVKQPYTYTAREYDRETGLYYYRARYYDAKVGRFLQKDPILQFNGNSSNKVCKSKLPIGFIFEPWKLNPYVYVINNPINKVDPLGLAVAMINCQAAEILKIRSAVSKADTASQTCLPECDRDKFKQKIQNLTVKCIPRTRSVYNPNSYICGRTYNNATFIEITPDGLSGDGCGCLESTILHEVTHTIGYSESEAQGAERKCFNCQSSIENNFKIVRQIYPEERDAENINYSKLPIVLSGYLNVEDSNSEGSGMQTWFAKAINLIGKILGPSEASASEGEKDKQLQLIIYTPKESFLLHEKIPMTIEFKNISNKPVIGWWFFEEYYHRVTEGGEFFPEVISDVLIQDKNNHKIIYRGKWTVKLPRIKLDDFIVILPAESYKYDVYIQEGENQFGINKTGQYRIQVLYKNYSKTWIEKKILEGKFKKEELLYPLSYYWDGELKSNEINIRVE